MKPQEEIMKMWDSWRKYIAEGGKASWPRDAFENLIDCYDQEIKQLQTANDGYVSDDDGWPRKPALELKIPIGVIACPACGAISHGAITPECGICDKLYFECYLTGEGLLGL